MLDGNLYTGVIAKEPQRLRQSLLFALGLRRNLKSRNGTTEIAAVARALSQ